MLVAVLAFLGGMLTILSPCILPVLPFVFARGDKPFVTSTLPLLLGMALTFALVATLAAVGGAWAVHLNQYGRILALVVLLLFALTLISRRLATALAAPFVKLGNRLLQPGPGGEEGGGVLRSVGLGVATGLLWAPCAGPILGLVLTGAAVSGPNPRTTLLLLAYAAGAATSLAVATLAGGKVFAKLKQGLGAGEWVRRGLGVAILAGVAAIALGWDRGLLTQVSSASTNRLEQALIGKIDRQNAMTTVAAPVPGVPVTPAGMRTLPVERTMPSLNGAKGWINSGPLTTQSLRGKVVVIDFWTYSCINCLRSIPYVKAWYEKYKDHGLVVIGVHSPEFAFERDSNNVKRAVKELGITYPVALDNDFTIWRAFANNYWPAHYFVDANGQVRAHHFGEGSYDEGEQIIRQLLNEAGNQLPADGAASPLPVKKVEMPGDAATLRSPETYIGSARADRFVSAGGIVPDRATSYAIPGSLSLNQWALAGSWDVTPEQALLAGSTGTIAYRFHARDLHLVLAPAADGKAIPFKVLVDGEPPATSHGEDTDADGNGIVREDRLYQLIRQSGEVTEHTFTIEFLQPGVRAYAFTFG